MAFCRNCGAEMEDDKLYCTNCGAPMVNMAQPAPQKQGLNVGMLIFSIIVLICCSPIFGIISLIMTITAQNATPEDAKKKIKIALILNIIGIVVGLIINVVATVMYMELLMEML